MASSATLPACAICGEPAPKLCKSCNSSRYCSPECQQADWPVHKVLCKATGKMAERPSRKHKRGILFDPKSDLARFEWVKYFTYGTDDEQLADLGAKITGERGEGVDKESTDDDRPYQFPVLGPHLGPDLHRYSRFVQKNAFRNRPLVNTLEISYRDTFMVDGSSPNKALLRVTAGELGRQWRGPILVMRKQGVKERSPIYEDLEAADFRDIVDYFIWFTGGESMSFKEGNLFNSFVIENIETGKESRKNGKIKGVKVACKGERGDIGMSTAIEVPLDHPIWTTGEVPTIPRLVGMPVRTWKYPMGNIPWKGQAEALQNDEIKFLHMNTDLSFHEKDFGWMHPRWSSKVGSALVVCDDKRDMTRMDVEVLCDFCNWHIRPLVEEVIGMDGPPSRDREDVMKYVTKEKFRAYDRKYREEQDALKANF